MLEAANPDLLDSDFDTNIATNGAFGPRSDSDEGDFQGTGSVDPAQLQVAGIKTGMEMNTRISTMTCLMKKCLIQAAMLPAHKNVQCYARGASVVLIPSSK